MKKIIRLFAVTALTLATLSCTDDSLELANPNSLSSATAFSTDADMDATLVGVYHSFYNNFFALLNSIQFSGQTDEMTTNSVPDIQAYSKLVYSNMNHHWNSTAWNRLYEQIARCNQVIQYSENITEWPEFDKAQIVAQARAIRAYDYYCLTMMYQSVPYVDYVAPASDQPVQTSFDELCQHIIDDADYAYKTLPASYKSSEGYSACPKWKDQYRVTKWFAACVAAKTYMNWGDFTKGAASYHYSEALPYYKDVVENGGFSLTQRFADNFDINVENDPESIFEIQNEASADGWRNYYTFTNNGSVPSESVWKWKFFSAGPLGWTDYESERWLNYAFKNEKAAKLVDGSNWDQRIPATIFYAEIFDDFPQHVQWQTWNAETGFSYPDWSKERTYINKNTGQYMDWKQVNNDNSEGTNQKLFRLGEIMLDYAECLAATGDLSKAVSYIDQVRDRAGLSKLGERQNYKVESVFVNPQTGNGVSDFNNDYAYAAFENNSTAYTFKDILSILDLETVKEDAFECERLVDIRRWGISADADYLAKVKRRSYKYYANFTPVRAWIPMPTDDVNNNPNLSQLTGW